MLADIIPTHQAAQWLLVHIDRLLDHLGLEKAKGVEEWVYVIVIVLVALLLGWIIRRLILFGAKKFVRLRNSAAGRLMLQQRLMTKCSHVIPPLVVLVLWSCPTVAAHFPGSTLYLYSRRGCHGNMFGADLPVDTF